MTDTMCHHHVDDTDWLDERDEAADPAEEHATGPAFLADDAADDVELDREFDDRDVKTPGDD